MNKKLEKALKALGAETVKEMEGMDEAALKKRIVEANEAMRQAEDELEALPGYQEAKADIYLLSSGKREINKRQKAVICVALNLLHPGESDDSQ